MAKSRLHELSSRRQRLDRLALARDARDGRARPADGGGRGRRRDLEPDDLPEGARAGDGYDEQLRRCSKTEDDPNEIFLALAMQDVHDACDLMRPVWDDGQGQDGCVSLEVDPTLAYDREATFEQAIGSTRRSTGRTSTSRSRRRSPASPRSRTASRKGNSINVTLIFSLERYAAVAEAYIRGLERLVAAGGDPTHGRVGRELLRLARRHRGRPAARGDRRRRDELAGQARDREREARLPALAETFSGPRWEFLAGKGATAAALPLGVDLDEEPGVPRRALRRGADRAGDGEHDAGGDDRGLPGSRRGRGDTLTEGVDEARAAARASWPRSASTTTTSSTTLEAEGVQKFADSFEELLDGIRAKRRELAAA